MFAFWLNAMFAAIYTFLAITYPDDVTTFTVWAGGLHTGLAFALAAVALGDRIRRKG